jgi:3-oxoadipate enol-lactonase
MTAKNDKLLAGVRRWSRDAIARRVAQDIPDGAVVNLGIGAPTAVGNHLGDDKEVVLHSENGVIGMGPAPAPGDEDHDLINAGKQPVTLRPGGCFFHHADSFAMMRGGHLDLCVLGAFQVSAGGDLANWHTGAPDAIPAVGGAMDLAIGAKKTVVMMDYLTKSGEAKLVPACTYPLTGLACVSRLYTDLAVIDLQPGSGSGSATVVDLAPGLTLASLQSLTPGVVLQAGPDLRASPSDTNAPMTMQATTSLTRSAPRLRHDVLEPLDGGPARLTFVLAHALGCDASMWDDLARHLAAHARVVRYDQRGHGGSDAPAGPYSMADLADDAARLIDALALGPVVWIGLSMGGMIGQELALRHPAKVRALVLANTTSGYPAEAQAGWAQRIAGIRQGGLAAVVDGALQRWFHPGFHAAQPATVAHWRAKVLGCDAAGYIACCEAIAGVDTTSRLPTIGVPTLVIAGALDLGTPPEMARTIAQAVPGARLVVLLEASHLSVLEQPAAFREALDDWLPLALAA